MNKRVLNSLRLQLFCAVMLSLVIGIAVFSLSFLIGNILLDRTVYGKTFAAGMADLQFSKLQDFVNENHITPDNLQRLHTWCSRGDKVYLTVYQDDILLYESHSANRTDTALPTENWDPNLENPENEYILTLTGDVKVRAFLYYYAGDAFYFIMTVISGLLAFVAFSLCFVILIGRKVSYISQLKQELDILAGGQLEYPVTVTGCDELGELAAGIEHMRRSILKHQEVENQMRSANSELITAMSHDLRTPLTSLLAYLEILERRKFTDEEQMYVLIHKSVGQTMRIRQMADKLFEYFLAYATEWEAGEMERMDADTLFQQMLGDYAYALDSSGMCSEIDFSETAAYIRVNTALLQRALDNLYSNLLKYADPTEIIRILYKKEGDRILISISNKIRADQIKSESSAIGLVTCRRIVEYHKGIFSAGESGERYHVCVSLPTVE